FFFFFFFFFLFLLFVFISNIILCFCVCVTLQTRVWGYVQFGRPAGPVGARRTADFGRVCVLHAEGARPVGCNSTIKKASPKAGIVKSDKVRLMPGL
ncbi:hypothetical protein, partial [Escherichia coli]|uniref:hypothetical protein n=1 Tax=Escherichia coli TaxID=562 RepID=UPI001BAF9B4E